MQTKGNLKKGVITAKLKRFHFKVAQNNSWMASVALSLASH